MRTSPAFQFYPTDFLLGTAIFTPAEVGAYIRLLCHQWESGSVPNDVKLLARLSQSDEQTIETILVKFSPKKDGTLVNLKMEKVRKEADEYRKSRSSNGKKGGRPKKHMVSVCLPHGKHSESPPSPSPSPSPSPKEEEGGASDLDLVPEFHLPDEQDMAQVFMETWNKTIFQKIREMTQDRKKKLKDRLANPIWARDWQEGLIKAQTLPLYRGEIKPKEPGQAPWKMDADFFLRDDKSLNNILERNQTGPARYTGKEL